jgi:hypothetical protein
MTPLFYLLVCRLFALYESPTMWYPEAGLSIEWKGYIFTCTRKRGSTWRVHRMD